LFNPVLGSRFVKWKVFENIVYKEGGSNEGGRVGN